MKQVDKPLKEINYVVFFLNFLSTKRHKVSSFNQTLHKVVPIFKNQSIREMHPVFNENRSIRKIGLWSLL